VSAMMATPWSIGSSMIECCTGNGRRGEREGREREREGKKERREREERVRKGRGREEKELESAWCLKKCPWCC